MPSPEKYREIPPRKKPSTARSAAVTKEPSRFLSTEKPYLKYSSVILPASMAKPVAVSSICLSSSFVIFRSVVPCVRGVLRRSPPGLHLFQPSKQAGGTIDPKLRKLTAFCLRSLRQ